MHVMSGLLRNLGNCESELLSEHLLIGLPMRSPAHILSKCFPQICDMLVVTLCKIHDSTPSLEPGKCGAAASFCNEVSQNKFCLQSGLMHKYDLANKTQSQLLNRAGRLLSEQLHAARSQPQSLLSLNAHQHLLHCSTSSTSNSAQCRGRSDASSRCYQQPLR